MQVMKRIEGHLGQLRKMRDASPGHTRGLVEMINILELARARIEYLEKAVDERLPSEAEIALQLLPTMVPMHSRNDERVEEAFRLAAAFIEIKDQRK